jgi:hypothetical protein
MRRRVLLQSLIAVIPFRGARLWAQTASFPGPHEKVLNDLAAAVLPASLGRARTDAVAVQFVRWVREYRAGAEMQTGYGFTRVRYKPASPAPKYVEQLAQLASAPITKARLTEMLRAANIKDLSGAPDGNNIISDLMSFYFQSPEANDLAYNAAIGKDQCRTLANSGAVPAPLKGGPTDAAI